MKKGAQMSAEEKKQGLHYFSLQPSEMAIFRGAAAIFAGYISSGDVNEDNRHQYYKAAVRDAISIGKMVERAVQSDEELAL
jgi:hypothetical protein